MAKKPKGVSRPNKSEAADEQIKEIGLKLKNALENKDWKALEKVCSVRTVWYVDRPVLLKDWLEMVKGLLEHAQDIELSIVEVKKTELAKDTGHLSLRTQLIWSDEKTWEERESEFDMLMGFVKRKGIWKLGYLGFTPYEVAPPVMIEPVAEAKFRPDVVMRKPYFKFEDYYLYPYFEPPEIAYPPWWPIPPWPEPWPGPWPGPPPPYTVVPIPEGYMLVYMPVVMPARMGVSAPPPSGPERPDLERK